RLPPTVPDRSRPFLTVPRERWMTVPSVPRSYRTGNAGTVQWVRNGPTDRVKIRNGQECSVAGCTHPDDRGIAGRRALRPTRPTRPNLALPGEERTGRVEVSGRVEPSGGKSQASGDVRTVQTAGTGDGAGCDECAAMQHEYGPG